MTEHRTGTDVIDELTSDQHEAVELLHRIPSVTDPDQRPDPADTVIGEIVRYSVAEEMYVYPAMREYEPRFDKLICELTEKLSHHAHGKETEKLAPTRPHPGVPHSQLFHKTVGPGVGLVDRLRDKLTDRAPHLSGPGRCATTSASDAVCRP